MPESSASAAMTLPRADRDLLMACASSSCLPVACVLRTISDPARSTKKSLDDRRDPWAFTALTVTIKTEWLRLEPAFIAVAALARALAPLPSTSSSRPSLHTALTAAPSMKTPRRGSSRTARFSFFPDWSSRSRMRSR